MAKIIQNVEFLNNPARFSEPYRFRVLFECMAPLPDGTYLLLISFETYSQRFTPKQTSNGASYTSRHRATKNLIKSSIHVSSDPSPLGSTPSSSHPLHPIQVVYPKKTCLASRRSSSRGRTTIRSLSVWAITRTRSTRAKN